MGDTLTTAANMAFVDAFEVAMFMDLVLPSFGALAVMRFMPADEAISDVRLHGLTIRHTARCAPGGT